MPGPERRSRRRGRRAHVPWLSEAAALQVEPAAEWLRAVRAGYEHLWQVQYRDGSVLLE